MSFRKNYKQSESLKTPGFKAKLGSFLNYYKVHIFIIMGILIFPIAMICANFTQKDTVFCAALVHCSEVSDEATSAFQENYIAHAGIDPNKHEVQINCNPSQLMIRMAAAQVDVMVSGSERFAEEAALSTFYDLRDIMTEEQLAKYEPYFYYADQTVLDARKELPESDDLEKAYPAMPDPGKPEEMEQPIPIGLFVTDCTVLTEAYYFDNDNVAIGIVGNAPNIEKALEFIDYLFQ